MSLQYFEEKKISFYQNVFLFFIAILCTKILCVTWALGGKMLQFFCQCLSASELRRGKSQVRSCADLTQVRSK